MPPRPLALRSDPLDEVGPSNGIVVRLGQLVGEEPDRMKRIVQLVEHGRREHPHRLITLHALEPGARPFLRRLGAPEARAQPQQQQL